MNLVTSTGLPWQVSVALITNHTQPATLGGTSSINVVDGWANFTDLSIRYRFKHIISELQTSSLLMFFHTKVFKMEVIYFICSDAGDELVLKFYVTRPSTFLATVIVGDITITNEPLYEPSDEEHVATTLDILTIPMVKHEGLPFYKQPILRILDQAVNRV